MNLRALLRTLHPRQARQFPLRYALTAVAAVLLAAWLLCALSLCAFRFLDPPTTALQTQRRIESWFQTAPYQKRYLFVPLSEISPDLQHAVIAAEDARFYQHHGFDWQAIELAAENDIDGGRRLRGGSTLTQQLVKNLFFGASRSLLRKAAEFTLVPVAELVLGKRRILELYLNTVELGPGIYGVEAASRAWYSTSARHITRDQASRLAAILPAPRKRHPARMNSYSAIIQTRMRQMNW
ncbi:MAG TPA: monofunctional biosynthetic peptidoglycan transglycosylase [Acidobacteriaceae bacterium]|jgi:monofunctional biosynthetic peptidoglycan transglycosylase|nr:monofunctional biosynthetic peptidoglycan transglycosylase [Acidobacteriaceae bacterium]